MLGQIKHINYLIPIVICLCICWIRVSMIGSYPCTDEGIWSYYSLITNHVINSGNELTLDGYINLYPTLCSFVFDLEINPFLSLRILDLIFACLSFYILYLICIQYTDSKIISFLIILPFIFVINNPKYIQAGFKNSIIISSFFIYLSFYLFLINVKNSQILYFFCGFSIATAVLLREFHIFICCFISIIYLINIRRKSLPLIFGIITSLFITILLLIWLRDISFYDQLINAYLKLSNVYKHNKEEIFTKLENSFNIFLLDIWVIIPFLIYLIFNLIISYKNAKILFLFIAFTSLLLIEPILKISAPYHFCSIYFLIPIFYSQLHHYYLKYSNGESFFIKNFFIVGLILSSIYSIHLSNNNILHRYKNNTIPNIKSLFYGNWNKDFIQKSHYLSVSQKIIDQAQPSDTLCVSGYAHVLFPLTRLLPTHSNFDDLYYVYLSIGEDNLKSNLNKNAPNFIYLSKRDHYLYSKLLSIVNSTLMYDVIQEYEINNKIHYGQFSATLYKLKS